jgi:hypothetical protein
MPDPTLRRFKKKPLKIDAVQLNVDNAVDVAYWCGGKLDNNESPQTLTVIIPTLEGPMTARDGWYIVKGIAGEFYPVKQEIFEDSYDEIVPVP